ncbi:hypothetical protein NS183_07915 [Microbacterium testaceum]|uniref:hypothetical protein n=1 Tax=Microbacterium testaceum TaxID=2033 RepID=UPI000734A0D9|nr:hypothetical protein [Microbacterium testaceum]KTS90696.1 hypothetical protein NS183_07915 [Microbacterium testaceum]
MNTENIARELKRVLFSSPIGVEATGRKGQIIWAARGLVNDLLEALSSPPADAARVLADPKGGCSCEPFDQDAGGGYVERLAEYEPDCPEHSHHLYDPREGAWIIDPRGKVERSDAGSLGSGHSPSVETADEREDSGGSVEEPSTHLIHGPASSPPANDVREALAITLAENAKPWSLGPRIVDAVLERFDVRPRGTVLPPADDVRAVLHELIVLHDPRGLARPVGAVEAIMSDPRIEVRPYGTVTEAEVERSCEIMHDAYEAAAASEGWDTQEASRKPWVDVPEANKRTMRHAVRTLLEARS